jgi:hypothetical protein
MAQGALCRLKVKENEAEDNMARAGWIELEANLLWQSAKHIGRFSGLYLAYKLYQTAASPDLSF